ncbi:MAG: T9SS type A sorting domain-containing protein [Ignavibacteriales bacterium]|nr:T9SS type A sorting domain-containing protein [Ignavibacteriales bacterium]
MKRLKNIFYLIILSASLTSAGVPITLKSSWNHQLFRPIDVTVSQTGTIAVADIHRKQISLYDEAHRLQRAISLEVPPTSVAFKSDGNILVGTSNDVLTLDQSGTIIDRSSQHGISFQSVVDLAVDGDGSVFIVEREMHRVTVMNAAGEVQSYIGMIGNNPGQLRFPIGISISKTADEIFVADAGNSRVQVFSKNGQFLRGFGEHIKQTDGVWQFVGTFARMSGIATDSDDRIYISDAGLNHLQIFDNKGNHIGFLGRDGKHAVQFRVPAGVTISEKNNLFIASTAGSDIKEYSIETTTDVKIDPSGLPQKYSLEQNFPNPFNPATQIKFSLPEPGWVTLKIYDIVGREVIVLASEDYKGGMYTIEWNGRNSAGAQVASGIYFYHLQVGDKYSQTNKMVFLK